MSLVTLVIKFFQEIFSIQIKMKIAIIGGGINGLFTAWELAKKDYQVDLYESKKVLSQTSSSSSKLLHGGIRYLEFGHIPLVRQSLIDRHWWFQNVPQHCTAFKMLIPIYKNSKRKSLVLYFGAILYKLLAGRYSLGPSKWNTTKDININKELKEEGLIGAVSFYDLQMDEEKLGQWVKNNAIISGVQIFEDFEINSFNPNGELFLPKGEINNYDFIINAAGPWAANLNKKNNIVTDFDLDLIRGSHLLLNFSIQEYYLFQEELGNRIVFIMPYKNMTLIGTTEIEQNIQEDIQCSSEEKDYLLNIYNNFFNKKASQEDIHSTFSGLRPIVKKVNKISKNFIATNASREMTITKNNKLISLYGGKWTSAPSTAKRIAKYIN